MLKFILTVISFCIVACCTVRAADVSMNTQLESVLTGADYVRIRTGGTCHRVPPQEKTICEFSSSSRIRELIPLLSVVEDAWAPDCPCCGGPTIEFYKNKQLIAVFGLHHGNRVRWIGSQWPGDGFLLDGRGLANWLAEQGAPELKMEILAAEEQARNYQNCLQEWMQLLPKALQPYTQAISNGYFDLRYDVALKKSGRIGMIGCVGSVSGTGRDASCGSMVLQPKMFQFFCWLSTVPHRW